MTPAGTGKRIFAAALCLLLLCALLAAPAAALTGHARRTVRAGVSDADTPGTNGGENRTVAFQKDYLQALAEYANWDLVYVEAPWSECLEMARTGEIDVLVDVSRTQERLAYYDFSSESMSADVLKDDVQKCLDAGMNGHVAKPVEPAALRKALEEAIEKRV